jgi:hypothetical protein
MIKFFHMYLFQLILDISHHLWMMEHIEDGPVHGSLNGLHPCAVHITDNLVDLTICN